MFVVVLPLLAAVVTAGSPWPDSATARAKATLTKMSLKQKLSLTFGWNKLPTKCRADFRFARTATRTWSLATYT